MAQITIVDKNDKVIGYKERADSHLDTDITRVTALWLINSKNQTLLAQRSFTKVFSKGKWGVAVAGTVEKGEDYESNIIKEAFEEVGVQIVAQNLIKGPYRYVEAEHMFFCQVYFYNIDLNENEFSIQKDEVEQIKWISEEDLTKWYLEKPSDFTSSFEVGHQIITKYLSEK